jgi:DNA-binding transcriptional MerR regulator
VKPSRKAREEAGGKNQDGFTLPARSCYVIGVDTNHGPEHPLFKGRAADVAAGRKPYDERMLRSMASDGVLEAVRVQLVQVDEGDKLWPPEARGKLVHVVLLGGNRIVHFRHVLKTAPVGSDDAWQVRCLLDTDKDPRRQFSVQIAENVCRRVLDDEELTQQIQQGLNVGLTLEELAERLDLTMAKAKRLRARGEGVPEKPAKAKVKRVPSRELSRVAEHMSNGHADSSVLCRGRDIASLIDVARGRIPLSEASDLIRELFTFGEQIARKDEP